MNLKTLGVGERYTHVHTIHIEYLSDAISERNGSFPLHLYILWRRLLFGLKPSETDIIFSCKAWPRSRIIQAPDQAETRPSCQFKLLIQPVSELQHWRQGNPQAV